MSQQLSQQQPILLTNGHSSTSEKGDSNHEEETNLKIRKLEQVVWLILSVLDLLIT